jgi:hypothetical protein
VRWNCLFTPQPEHPAKNQLFPAHPPPIPDGTPLQQAPLVGVHMGLWPLITGGKNPPPSWQVARCKPWAPLVTQRPTCQIAALYTHWCRMRTSLTSTAVGLLWGRQNERDLAMVKDPLTDLEEVVGGT